MPIEEKSEEEKKIEAFANEIEEVQKKHKMRIVPAARLEVEHIKSDVLL